MDPVKVLDQDLLLCLLTVARLNGEDHMDLPLLRTGPPTSPPECNVLRSLRAKLPRGNIELKAARNHLALFTGDLFRDAVGRVTTTAAPAADGDTAYIRGIISAASDAVRRPNPVMYGDTHHDVGAAMLDVVRGTGTALRAVEAMERRGTLLRARGVGRQVVERYLKVLRPYLLGDRWGPGSRGLKDAMLEGAVQGYNVGVSM